jgi:hypothetical protein
MGARNQVGIGLSYRTASLCSLAIQFQTRCLESIPRPIAGLKFPTLTPLRRVLLTPQSFCFVCLQGCVSEDISAISKLVCIQAKSRKFVLRKNVSGMNSGSNSGSGFGSGSNMKLNIEVKKSEKIKKEMTTCLETMLS